MSSQRSDMLCNYRMSGYGYEYQEGSRPDSSAIHLASSSRIWSLLAENHTLTKNKSRSIAPGRHIWSLFYLIHIKS